MLLIPLLVLMLLFSPAVASATGRLGAGDPTGPVVVKRLPIKTGSWRSILSFDGAAISLNVSRDGTFRAYTYNLKRKRGRVGRHTAYAITSLSATGIQTCRTPGAATTTRPATVTLAKLKLDPQSGGYLREPYKIQRWGFAKEATRQRVPGVADSRTLRFRGGFVTARRLKIVIAVTDRLGSATCSMEVAGVLAAGKTQ